MHNYSLKIPALLIAVASAAAYGQHQEQGLVDQSPVPFEVKSGVLESDCLGSKVILYFDDYGRKRATHTSAELNGVRKELIEIATPAGVVTYDPVAKQGTKEPVLPAGPPEGVKTTKLRAKRVLGKTCEGTRISTQDGSTIETWTYRGVPLVTRIQTPGSRPVEVRATKLEMKAVEGSKFTVPHGVQIEAEDAVEH